MHDIHNKGSLDLSLFHRIDINLYPLFIAVFEQKSISKAAHVLSISQSAASHALQRLRQHLHDELFLRSGHQMLPTSFSEQIYPSIKQALANIQAISQQSQQFEPSLLQSLKIAMHDEVEPMVFPQLVQHFQALNPKMQFFSIKLDRKTVVSDILTQQIDFFIDIEQNFGDKIESKTLVNDHFMVCSQLPSMDATTYLNSPHIGVSSRRTGVLIEDIYLKRQQLSRQVLLRCQHYSTALQMIKQQTQTILTIPQNILVHLQVPEQVNIYPTPLDFPDMNLSLYWSKDLSQNLRFSFLRSEILKQFA